jgi:sugar/nucleoside kinase (ribokinase family)
VVSLAVVGNVDVDLLLWPAWQVPPPGAEHRVERADLRVGGAAAITGAALARLGDAPIVCGCVGDDALADVALAQLGAYGVDTAGVLRVAGTPTGISVAFEARDRDRSFLIALGSLERFDASMVPDGALEASFFLLCGYFNLPAIRGEAAVGLLRRARDRGGTTLLDTGWEHDGWPESTRAELGEVLPFVDVFLPNEDEATRLAGEDDPERAVVTLASRSGGSVVVKLGARGALAAIPDGPIVRLPAAPVRVVDTTGAGDAFNAGLMHALAGGAELDEAARFGVAVGSAVVGRDSDDRYPRAGELSP